MTASGPERLASRKAARAYRYRVWGTFTHSLEHSTGGFTGTLAALFFVVFLSRGIVPFLLLGLVVVVSAAFDLRRGVRLALRRHGRDRRVVTYHLRSSGWKRAGEPEYAQMSEPRPCRSR